MNRTSPSAANLPRGDRQAELQPWFLGAMLALYVCRPLWPSESAAPSGDGLPVVLLWLLLTTAWLASGWYAGRMLLRFCWIDAAVGGLILVNIVAALLSLRHDATRPALNMLWEWIALGLGYGLARQLITTPQQIRAVLAVMIALAVAVSGHGLYQYFISLPETRAAFAADPDALLRSEGMWYPPGSVERELLEQRVNSSEPLASFALTNSLAGFLTPWLVICGSVLFMLRGDEDRSRRKALAALVVLLMAGLCLLLTKSRSAYGAVALGLLVVAICSIRARGRLKWPLAAAVVLIVLLVLTVALATGGLDWEVLAEAPKSLGYRWQYWQATRELIRAHPWFGVGPGHFADHYTGYKLPTASEEISDPHNLLLEVWATAGIAAALALLAVLMGLFRLAITSAGEIVASPADAPRGPSARNFARAHARTNAHADERAVRAILIGGLAGWPLAVILPLIVGPLIEVPCGIFVAAGELLLAALTIWLWMPWVRTGFVPRFAPALAALALAVNLLAAGGINFAGVVGSFWLLAALAVNPWAGNKTRQLNRTGALVAWLISLAGVAACVLSAYQPAVSAAHWQASAMLAAAGGDPRRAEYDLQRATIADRRSSAALSALGDLRYQRWQQQRDRASFDAFEQALLQAISARPYQAALWLRLGEGYLAGYPAFRDRDLASKAVAAGKQAVKLYPNHAREHAFLALAWLADGDRAAADRETQAALQFDAITPHADQKLRPELREANRRRTGFEIGHAINLLHRREPSASEKHRTMFHLLRPSDDEMHRLVERAAEQRFTYREVGASHDANPAPGYAVAHQRVRLGEGLDCFRAACQGLTDWHMFPDYLERFPAVPLLDADQCVALRMTAFGLWVSMLCRIVYTIDFVLPMGGLKFGFAYGTLPGHVERGEERFLVEQLPDDSVWYDLYAFSRPQSASAWLGLPITRHFQRRFADDSCRRMFDYCQQSCGES